MIAALLTLALGVAHAHALGPDALEVVVDGPRLTWTARVPLGRPIGTASARPVLPPGCAVDEVARLPGEDAQVERTTWTCDATPDRVQIVAGAAPGTVVTVRAGEGVARQLVTASGPVDLAVTAAPAVLPAFLGVGLSHLLGGPDHVLLVVSLLLLLGVHRRLLVALTGFTVGHAVTLGLAVTGVVRPPTALVETAIAASLVWAAVEVIRERDAPGTAWLARWPAALSVGVGLVHGLGFAGALADVGLPADAVPQALVGFHLGLEAGQLLVVIAVGGALALLRRRAPSLWRPELLAYGIGALAVSWVIERMA